MLKITPFKQFQILIAILLFTCTTINAQVGIGNDNPITTLDVNGAIGLREGGTLDLSAGANNNIPLGTPAYSVYRIVQTGAAGTINIGGIAPIVNNSVNGQILILQNTTTENIVIQHEVTGNGARRIQVPGGQDLLLRGQYASVTLMYNDAINRWMVISHDENTDGNIQSVSLATDYVIDTSSYSDITGMSLTFTASKTSALVMFSASGLGFTNSMSSVYIRAMDGSNIIGGSKNKIQNYDDVTGTITTWSLSFNKLLTGLTIGNSYTIRLQGYVSGVFGLPDAGILATTQPDESHLTLTILQ